MSTSSAAAFRALAQARRSSRRFQPNRKIPNEILRDVLSSTLRSPSSFNLQPTHIILVESQSIKEQLSQDAMLGAGNQYRTTDASALAVFLSDLEPRKRIDRVHQLEKDVRHPNYLNSFKMASSFLTGEGHAATAIKSIATDLLSEVQPMPVIEPVQAWNYKNASFMAQTFVYAAGSHELATCIMEGFDGRRVQEILRVPDRFAIPVMVAAGYEYEDPETFERTPRLNMNEVVFRDTFASPLNLEEEKENDASDTVQPENVGSSGR